MTHQPPLNIDYEGFARELNALRAEIEAKIGPEDLEHLKKIERWGRACTALGYATAWMAPNPLSAWFIGHGSMVRWTMMMHHVGHRGYDRVPGAPERYTSKGFAQGGRRWLDWLDWIHPEAWKYEHNMLHHYHTGELDDPDLVEENTRKLRESDLPEAVKYAAVAFYAFTWKWSYYAPNTFQVLRRSKTRKPGDKGLKGRSGDTYLSAFNFLTDEGKAFWKDCVLPYGVARFVAVPALFLPLGPWAAFSVWANSLGAEALTNLYTFLVIASNHAGDDLYRFDAKGAGRAEYYVRQVTGSVNYALGSDVVDFLHGWLNYQIEHHLFPDIPMLKYQQFQPRIRAICEKYGVPYVQEGVFQRAKRLLDIMVGKTTMKRVDGFTRYTKQEDELAEAAE